MADVMRIGNHEVQREAEDFFIYRFGPTVVASEELIELSAMERAVWNKQRIYSISILDDETSISTGLVTRSGKVFRDSPPRTSAFVLRGYYLQTTLEFVLRTLRLLGVKLEIQFFADEPSAWEWIEERRMGRGAGTKS